jgi:hypothetical protein
MREEEEFMSNARKRLLLASFVLIALALPAAALVSFRLKKKPPPTNVAPTTPANTGSAADKRKEKVEGEIIALTSHGFEPTEISRPHKHFILVIDNRSGLAEIQLSLEREYGNRVRDVSIAREQRNWSDDLDLPPGRYVLKEASHPSWVCLITVTSN